METTIILLLIGFGAGFYIRGLRAKTEAANAKRHADALDQQIATLRREIVAMHGAESRRLDEVARRKRFFEENDISDVENQIRFISQTELRAVRPVNKEAVRVLYALDEWIVTHRPDWRMAFEVSMGAFIKTSYDPEDRMQKAAFSSYNSKRVDFLLIDRFGQPMLVVEYNGTGHDLSDDAPGRMEVKRLALARAGIPLVEIPAKTSKSDIVRMVADTVLAT
ncbi:hypothetical protein GCM10011491_11050 [Brucella endophytica]|uniref:DUF2726 domain-containing protein n=1 Tax=Brucella endophytica TaxID=1963359 RepID=A0A916WCF8_9HYPH|nr:DUF2726 domain-containing protein [Brucella endophytica]GGA85263.1 hypothetical protein GCM10011491_11050 [Brucella endophytica]